MKSCPKCDCEKDLSEFGKDKHKKDGLSTYCKACVKIRNLEQKKSNPEYYKRYAKRYREENREILKKKSRKIYQENRERYLKRDREIYHERKKEICIRRKKERQNPEKKEKDRLRMQKWRMLNPKRNRQKVKKWQQKFKERHAAHQRVHRAVEDGILIRSNYCEKCKMKCKTEGHHEDYSKPLVVVWLCLKCHRALNQKVEVFY